MIGCRSAHGDDVVGQMLAVVVHGHEVRGVGEQAADVHEPRLDRLPFAHVHCVVKHVGAVPFDLFEHGAAGRIASVVYDDDVAKAPAAHVIDECDEPFIGVERGDYQYRVHSEYLLRIALNHPQLVAHDARQTLNRPERCRRCFAFRVGFLAGIRGTKGAFRRIKDLEA